MKLPARIEPRELDIPTLERLKRPKPKREHLPGLFLFSIRGGEDRDPKLHSDAAKPVRKLARSGATLAAPVVSVIEIEKIRQ